jgi:hypothetical protein
VAKKKRNKENTEYIIIGGEKMTDKEFHEMIEDDMEYLYGLMGLEFQRRPYESTE